MKRFKFVFVFTLLFTFLLMPIINVHADVGPKPSTTIQIEGMEGLSYHVTLIGKNIPGPYVSDIDHQKINEHHPIMDYQDKEGFFYVGKYWKEDGNAKIEWSYYPPYPFKILIITENNTTYVSDELGSYAFHSYYKINLSNVLDEGNEEVIHISVNKDYNYVKESFSFIFRVLLTIIVELLVALALGFRGKRAFIILSITNVITQVFLNLLLNVTSFYSGILLAAIFYLLAEAAVLLIEVITYSILFKDKGFIKLFLYTLIANGLSFLTGLYLYGQYYQSVNP